ncbi:phage holin family protein [Nonomuraea soli]|uniref:Putative membrane protein YqjE n=1 Tax=Nonomuraea soli TaxID=1032476 RepID=A0A7W0CSI3_9ACTN|nr:phage holin family protein [Nonomuraea soli]MBA2896522.1 putative membrane protein YqjE [Nonomuraea soli]
MTAPTPEQPTIGQLVSDLGADLSKLFRQEVELARTELREEAVKAGKAASLLSVAGVAGLMAAFLVSLAVVFGLDSVIDAGWAALIVAVIWGAVGAIAYTNGRKRMREVSPVPEKTVETLKEDARWARDLKS